MPVTGVLWVLPAARSVRSTVDRVQKRIVSSPALNIASKEVRLLAYLVRGERHLIERHNVVR